MRRLWQDIDDSRDKLGLGAAARANGAASAWDAWTGWASGVVGDASAQVTALSTEVGAILARLPGAGTCRAVSEGAVTVVRRLPVVGPVVDALGAVLPAGTDGSKAGKSSRPGPSRKS